MCAESEGTKSIEIRKKVSLAPDLLGACLATVLLMIVGLFLSYVETALIALALDDVTDPSF